MTKEITRPLTYLEWVALTTLYRYRDRPSSPARYVGLASTVKALIEHEPPLAAWIGNSANNQVHITAEGIATCEEGKEG